MKIPFVTFKPMEAELDKELREAFDRVYTRSWYIEGVEDEQLLAYLQKYNATWHQGYFYSRPIPFDEFKKLINI